MNWFGFGFNGFGQIVPRRKGEKDEDTAKVLSPVALGSLCSSCEGKTRFDPKKQTETSEHTIKVVASWSQRAAVYRDGDPHVCMSGFISGPDEEHTGLAPESKGCVDALISERYLTLSFADRVECWSLKPTGNALVWSGVNGVQDTSDTGPIATLPLVPGGYIASKPPFYRPLSPELHAVSLALGSEHAVLLTSSGTVYSWGSGSHGQLGHGSLVSEDEPQVLEALWGVPMKYVAAGGWHSACISAGGDLYVWGWNESGQIGLPSKGLKDQSQRAPSTEKGELVVNKREDNVFISIQAFPALVDVPEVSEISKVSCGSRHTASITSSGNLYTWGWGHYGQLGHGSKCSSDEPKVVEYFSNGGMTVEDVVCGLWNTFVCATPRKRSPL
ncbi:RCC1 domain-containing protein 1 [Pygocentrus nattereri]|uniref:RCC1 domain containing 1 n=1 Tax=Pygocentrus nattereri TaxID=42514 RepID=A0A3B4DHV4_PYGNA|nr:RCC1 domain-containing protein 1 [Pygocentrus nattereri]XP_017555563.1 RCC1 domain-containing protein 1 [Pygocentrus nattereri]